MPVVPRQPANGTQPSSILIDVRPRRSAPSTLPTPNLWADTEAETPADLDLCGRRGNRTPDLMRVIPQQPVHRRPPTIQESDLHRHPPTSKGVHQCLRRLTPPMTPPSSCQDSSLGLLPRRETTARASAGPQRMVVTRPRRHRETRRMGVPSATRLGRTGSRRTRTRVACRTTMTPASRSSRPAPGWPGSATPAPPPGGAPRGGT
jgi:hypothetical protein